MTETKIKTLLIASFVKAEKLDNFLNYIDKTFNIKKDKVFSYEIEDDRETNLITFKLKSNRKIDLNLYFNNSTIVNIKNGCLFSINGLNKLIEKETNCEKGNIEYNSYKINWEQYKDKLIICNKGELIIKNIKRIF